MSFQGFSIRLLGLALAFGITGPAFPQALEPVELEPPPPQAAIEPMETDRPDFTETTQAVPKGSLQVETGAFWDREDGVHTWHVPEALFRLGIRDGTELRYVAPEMQYLRGDETASGAGDMEAGLKQELGKVPGGIELALMPMVTLPTGGRRISGNTVEGSVTLLWSRDIGEKTEIGGNLEFGVVRADGLTFGFTPTLVLYRQLTERLGALVEYRGIFNAQGQAGNMLHYALTFKPTPRQQLDVRFGHGLSGGIEHLLAGIGYSFRLDGLF